MGSSLTKNIQTATDPLHYIESVENIIHIPEINMDEVRTIISAITNSASGNDELPASILKQCMDSYRESLTHLINLSISLGIEPDELKIDRVIPIFKGEDEQLVAPGFVDRPRRSDCTAGQMDGEAGWWTTSGNIGLPPLARVMGVGRQQQQQLVQNYRLISVLPFFQNI